jgi:pteridine reductase
VEVRVPVALVTGAGVRVGRAIAEALAAAGYDLLLHAHHSHAAAAELAAALRAAGRRAELFVADLGDATARDGVLAAVRQACACLDVLVNSAAAYESVPFGSLSRDQYTRMMAINLEAPLFLTQGLLPLLSAAAKPCVINITDVAAQRPYAGYAHYMVSKAALAMLTECLALELAPHIRVNAVAPGTVLFPESFDAAKRARIVKRIPLETAGTPADIGGAVVFLVRDAPYITGHTLVVDGGTALR